MLKLNKALLLYAFAFGVLSMLSSCSGCTKTGRERLMVEMAQEEASKPSTTPLPNTIIKDKTPKPVKIKDVVTPKEQSVISNTLSTENIPAAEGNLIQTEGLVLQEVTRLTIDLNTSDYQLDQLITLQEHIQNNWHYLFDPKVNRDTWRSAEATLALKYKGRYTGDCDDFAILMASIARQIGLTSRVVGGFNNNAGHAFAEVLVPSKAVPYNLDSRRDQYGTWLSLDWFRGLEHRQFDNIQVLID